MIVMNKEQRACQRGKSVGEEMEMALINEWLSILNQLVGNIVILWEKDKHFDKIQYSCFIWVKLWFSNQAISFLWWPQFSVCLLFCFTWREIQWSPFYGLQIDLLKSLLADDLAWWLFCSNNSAVPLAYILVLQLCYWNKSIRDKQ